MLEVQPADLGERVHEAVEHARRRGRKEEEDRLRSHVRKQAGAAEPVVPIVAAPEEQDEPADRERHVEEAVAEVEAVDQARVAKECTLHRGLDVEPKTLLAGDDALGVLACALPPTPPEHQAPHEQVEPVDGEAEGELTSHREARPSHAGERIAAPGQERPG